MYALCAALFASACENTRLSTVDRPQRLTYDLHARHKARVRDTNCRKGPSAAEPFLMGFRHVRGRLQYLHLPESLTRVVRPTHARSAAASAEEPVAWAWLELEAEPEGPEAEPTAEAAAWPWPRGLEGHIAARRAEEYVTEVRPAPHPRGSTLPPVPVRSGVCAQ